MEKINKKYVVTYHYNPEQENIAQLKIGMVEPQDMQSVCQLALLNIPAMSAFRKENPALFNKVTLDYPHYSVEMRIVDMLVS